MLSVTDCITSFIDGRVRLRHPALKNAALAETVSAFVRGVDGVENVSANPVTGSLLIVYDTEKLSREDLLELAQQGAALLPVKDGKKNGAEGVRSLADMLLSRRASRLAGRVMLVSLPLSLAGAVSGMGALHRISGAVFTLASLQHMAAHRKMLW